MVFGFIRNIFRNEPPQIHIHLPPELFPNQAEQGLLAPVSQSDVLYHRNDDGSFVPVASTPSMPTPAPFHAPTSSSTPSIQHPSAYHQTSDFLSQSTHSLMKSAAALLPESWWKPVTASESENGFDPAKWNGFANGNLDISMSWGQYHQTDGLHNHWATTTTGRKPPGDIDSSDWFHGVRVLDNLWQPPLQYINGVMGSIFSTEASICILDLHIGHRFFADPDKSVQISADTVQIPSRYHADSKFES
ncbi:hypothetical protein C8J56DRAFT_888551 [Mycena floridula]|nr:hypothetical protein C8J56DRAFT_888551 [Mycena floridula]